MESQVLSEHLMSPASIAQLRETRCGKFSNMNKTSSITAKLTMFKTSLDLSSKVYLVKFIM